MRSLLQFMLCFFLIGSGLFGQSNRDVLMRGEGWRSLGDDGTARTIKCIYLLGLHDGALSQFLAIATESTGADSKERHELIDKANKSPLNLELVGTSFEQLADGVDDLYRDYANRHIPVLVIATLVNKRIRGIISDQEVPAELAKLRSYQWPTR